MLSTLYMFCMLYTCKSEGINRSWAQDAPELEIYLLENVFCQKPRVLWKALVCELLVVLGDSLSVW